MATDVVRIFDADAASQPVAPANASCASGFHSDITDPAWLRSTLAEHYLMNAPQVHASLVTLCPDFGPYWDSTDNCFREDDGGFSLTGVFAQFSHFFREHFASLPESAMAALGRLVDDCLAVSGTEVETAVTTCFLENIAGEESALALAPYLGQRAQRFLAPYG